MTDELAADLVKLGRDVAEHVAGVGAVEQVEVSSGEDSSDLPAYFFTFLIDQNRTDLRPGLLRIRLSIELRDALLARHDEHYPYIQILDRTDWGKRARA